MKINKNLKGFTLTEILVVVSILAILAFLGVISYLNNVHKAQDAERKADLDTIRTAVEGYYSDHDCYPAPSLVATCESTSLQPYLNTIPCDPVYKDHYCYFVSNPSPTEDCYQEYHLLAILKNKSDPEIAKLGCDGAGYCGWDVECGATSDRYGYNYGISSENTAIVNSSAAGVPPPEPPPPQPSDLPLPGLPGSNACMPTGDGSARCNSYEDPLGSGCPITFSNEAICQQYCDYSSVYWCKH